MDEPIDAIYENGVLRPLEPLPLPENARVRVTVSTHGIRADTSPDAYAEVWRDLDQHKGEVAEALKRTGGVTTAEMLRRASEAAGGA